MDKRQKIMEQKCRKCGYSYITGMTTCCDYMGIMGHSRGCSIEECQLHKDHPREHGENKIRAYQVKAYNERAKGKRKRLKKADPAVKALTAAIMGKHE